MAIGQVVLAASVGGGRFNEAAGSYSSVSGGSGDVVTGIYDWRAGDEFFSTDSQVVKAATGVYA